MNSEILTALDQFSLDQLFIFLPSPFLILRTKSHGFALKDLNLQLVFVGRWGCCTAHSQLSGLSLKRRLPDIGLENVHLPCLQIWSTFSAQTLLVGLVWNPACKNSAPLTAVLMYATMNTGWASPIPSPDNLIAWLNTHSIDFFSFDWVQLQKCH